MLTRAAGGWLHAHRAGFGETQASLPPSTTRSAASSSMATASSESAAPTGTGASECDGAVAADLMDAIVSRVALVRTAADIMFTIATHT